MGSKIHSIFVLLRSLTNRLTDRRLISKKLAQECGDAGVLISPCWTPLGGAIGEGEHELYFKGRRAVWSIEGILKQRFSSHGEIVHVSSPFTFCFHGASQA